MNPKTLIFRVAKGLGIFPLVRATQWRRSRLLILGYHGISMQDEHEWNPELYMTAEHLRSRLQLLRSQGYKILPLDAALAQLQDGTLPDGAVSITFDDGAYDFAERALPVLQEFDAPATLYLTTFYCSNDLPVFDTALAYLLWKGRLVDRDLNSLLPGAEKLLVNTQEARAKTTRALYDHAKREGMSATDKNELLRSVANAVEIDFDSFLASRLLQLMTPEQVKAIPSDLVDVQLHTHRHRTPRNEAAFKRELRDNQASIAHLTGDSTHRKHFCYPSGDYAGEFMPWLRDEGVESATTCIPGLASSASDPLLLPRLMDTSVIHSLSFEAWACGFAELLPRRAEYRLDKRRLS